MKLNNLPKISQRVKKRLGRGVGSGKGKTAGRGTKGQKARGKIPVNFSGAGLALYKKLPKRSGLSNTVIPHKAKVLSLSTLNQFKPGTVIDLESLLLSKLIDKKSAKSGVKLLADKGLTVKLTVKVPVSKSAQLEIEQKGGKVEKDG